MSANEYQQRLGFWWIAEDHPDLPAVVHCPTGETMTFGELAGAAHQLVHGLRARGFGEGSIIAYMLPNGIDILFWQLATQESGMRFISLNPQLSAAEVREIADHSGANAVVIDAQFADRVGEVVGAPSVTLRVAMRGEIEGFETFEALVAGQPTTRPDNRTLGGSLVYSSGTTGKPKAITRSMSQGGDPDKVADGGKLFCQAFAWHPLQGAHMVSAGMNHGGCQGFYLSALGIGQALCILGKFDAETTLWAIDKFKITTAYMVPTQFVRLLRLPDEVKAKYDVSSMENATHSAAPCPRAVKQAMLDWWGPVIWETYGGMEGAATIAKPYRWLEKPGTVGRAVNGVKLHIFDKEGNELPAGEVGDVYIETGASTFEYKDEPEMTAAVKRGKAFTLGDVGYVDEDGYLFLMDRAKDMIIAGGVNIFPAEIEGVLHSHPAVHDVAVIGIPNAEWGEEVKAIVELREGFEPSDALAQEMIAFCREKLAGYKCPRSVDFRTDLPRTETGKLVKRRLRDEYWAEADQKI